MAQRAEDTAAHLEERFDAAVRVIRSLPQHGSYQPSDNMMLMFYSYYKQATLGPCCSPRPIGFWDSRGKAKWDAWSSLGNMTKEEAMMNYVDDIQLILETIPVSAEVAELVEKLGNFYAEVDGGGGQELETNEVDRMAFTRPFAGCADELRKPKPLMEERRGSPYPRLQVWEEGRWSLSSTEPPSASSLATNGIHSSLNSQLEDEELASLEPRAQRRDSSYVFVNGHDSHQDHSDVKMPEKSHRTTDSDNEEFCDSMEDLAMDEVSGMSKFPSSGSRRSSARRRDLVRDGGETLATLKARDDVTHLGQPLLEYEIGTVRTQSSLSRRGRGSLSPRTSCGSQLGVNNMNAACRCVPARGQSASVAVGDVNQQIAAALLRLQEDMADLLHRLHTLEVLTVSQSRSRSPSLSQEEVSVSLTRTIMNFRKYLWWPFPISPIPAVFVTFWPLVAHWLVHLYLQRRRRKIR